IRSARFESVCGLGRRLPRPAAFAAYLAWRFFECSVPRGSVQAGGLADAFRWSPAHPFQRSAFRKCSGSKTRRGGANTPLALGAARFLRRVLSAASAVYRVGSLARICAESRIPFFAATWRARRRVSVRNCNALARLGAGWQSFAYARDERLRSR